MMSAAKIDVAARLSYYADSARKAGRYEEASIFEASAKMVENAISRANQVETMRDRFAMSALQGLLASPQIKGNHDSLDEWPITALTSYAYQLADAMLEARGSI